MGAVHRLLHFCLKNMIRQDEECQILSGPISANNAVQKLYKKKGREKNPEAPSIRNHGQCEEKAQ